MSQQHHVAVLALDDVVAFDLGMPVQVFHAATDSENRRFYRVQTCTLGRRPVRTAAGFMITPEHGLEILSTADTVLVAGVHYGADVMISGAIDEEIANALRAAHDRGARIMSTCTGAFVLAAAGLLDGLRATTHWAHAETFRDLFPAVELDSDVLFVHDEPIFTAAGFGAGIDLCLQVVLDDYGSEVASLAARRCVVPSWRSASQAQYIVRPVPKEIDSSTLPVRTWTLEHLHESLDLSVLAARARMSTRTFTRRFRDETGLSPRKWLTQQRLNRARHLLETTNLAVDRVAEQSGFGTGATLRLQMSAALGVAPSAYRETFRGKASVD